MLSPDASWILRDAWKALAQSERQRLAPIIPAFVIEIRSRTDRLRHVDAKMQSYLQNGVEVAWLLDPIKRRVEIYRQGEETAQILEDPGQVLGEGSVSGFVLNLAEVYDSVDG